MTSIIGEGSWSMVKPWKLSPISEPPICAPFSNTMSSASEAGESSCMIFRPYGIRSVFQRPGMPVSFVESVRNRSAQASTVKSGGGTNARFQTSRTQARVAAAISTATSVIAARLRIAYAAGKEFALPWIVGLNRCLVQWHARGVQVDVAPHAAELADGTVECDCLLPRSGIAFPHRPPFGI